MNKNRTSLCRCLFLLVFLEALYCSSCTSPFVRKSSIINTKSGPVQGKISTSRDGRKYYSWLGIPYAKPPLGLLRFASPEPVEKWENVRDGTRYGASCVQNMFYFKNVVRGLEDCLSLNVFCPKDLHDARKKLLPVLFYIHGGAYIQGESRTYGAGFLMDEDIVLVSVNYRLGILGFLSTGDSVIRGNMGLKDQVQALKWVKENIEYFGGDRDRITIFGHSAGGASVHQLLLSPMSKGLFARAISSSGTASNTWGLKPLKKSVEKTWRVGMELGCPIRDTQELANCLRNASVEDLMKVAWLDLFDMPLYRPQKFGDPIIPTIEAVDDEDAFLTRHPLQLVVEGKAQRVPWLVGHTADEGLISIAQVTEDRNIFSDLETNIRNSIKSAFSIQSNNSDDIANRIYNFYFPLPSKPNSDSLTYEEKLKTYAKLFGDAFFNFDIHESIFYQRQFSAVYPYFLNVKERPNVLKLWRGLMSGNIVGFLKTAFNSVASVLNQYLFRSEPLQDEWGTSHFTDVFYVFPVKPLLQMSKTSQHYTFSKKYIRLMVDFASKNESELLFFSGVEFPPTPAKGPLKYFEIKTDNPRIINEPIEKRMKFLHSLNIRNISVI